MDFAVPPTPSEFVTTAQTPSSPDVGRRFVEPPDPPRELKLDLPRIDVPESAARSSYTLDDLLSLAEQKNPTILQARLHINATLAQAMQAGLYPNPVLNYSAEQIGVGGTAGEWHGATLRQRFVTAGKLELSRRKYLQRSKVAEHRAVAQQFRVCNDVRMHYYRTLAAYEVMSLRAELLKTAEDNLATVREMYNLGQANRADVHRANTELQRHRLSMMMAKNETRQQELVLASLVGIDARELQVQGELSSSRELIDFEAAYARLIDESPEMAAAYAKLTEDSIKVARERVEWIPDLVVSGGTGYNFEAGQTVAAAGLSIEIPLFDRNQGTIAQAEADWNRQNTEITRTRLRLQNKLSDEYSRYLTAVQHVMDYAAVVLPESREAYRLALLSYRRNREEWPRVLKSQRNYTNNRIDFVKYELARRTSEVSIDGYLLHGGLEAASSPTPPGHIDSTPKPR